MARTGSAGSTLPLAFALIAAMLLFTAERKARFMLGDTGSNSFGAVLGLSYAVYVPDIHAQWVVATLIVIFHAWTERQSLSRTIEANPLLSRIDSKIGVR
jgi:UDP-N-acetylmuramyl pentapeptide phosphotransferase/UDP-N-acetylglucosamine-1-phosphate transferase